MISRHNRNFLAIGVGGLPMRLDNMDAKLSRGDYDAKKPRCGIDPGLSGQVHRRRFGVATQPGHRFRNGVSSFTDAMKHNCSFGFFASSPFGKLNHLTVTCNRWKCPGCRKQLIAGWAAHFADCTASLATVYRHTIERRDWPNLYKRISRRGIRYIAVTLGDTRMAVYTDQAYGDCHQLSASDAAATFRRELTGYVPEQHQHPVSTCRDWKRPSKPSKYTRIPDVKPVKAQHVRTAAEQLGIALKPWTSDEAAGLEVLSSREDAMKLILLSEEVSTARRRAKQSIQPESWVFRDRTIRTQPRASSLVSVPTVEGIAFLEGR